MTSYDNFAPYYDLTMGDRGDVTELLREQINYHRPHASSLLELGSGTGSILQAFEGKFDVAGIEKSRQMLQISQQKLSKAALHQGDMTTFSLDKKFDVVICVFDTINHLPNFAAWQKVFQQVSSHLNPAGVFIFDMNTTGRLAKLTAMGNFVQHLGDTAVEMAITPAPSGAVDWHITVQAAQPDGVIQVFEDTARERSYPLAEVQTELARHFTILDQFDSAHQPPNDDSDRIYFVCRG